MFMKLFFWVASQSLLLGNPCCDVGALCSRTVSNNWQQSQVACSGMDVCGATAF
jgi:hypothetical protein